MKKSLIATSIALGLMSGAAFADSPYSKLYVFGDSLSDTGMFGGKATNRIGPDYTTGDFEYLGVELFAMSLKLDAPKPELMGGTNYAVGGFNSAQALASVASPIGQAHPILGPLSSYAQDSMGQADPNAIYYVSAGGNDFLQQPDYDGDGSFGPGDISAGAGNVFTAAAALDSMGANYIVVPNLVALDLSPAINFLDATAPGTKAITKAGVDGFNTALTLLVGGSNANIIMPDVNTAMVELFDNPGAYGFALPGSALGVTCFDGSCSAASGYWSGFEAILPDGSVNPNANPDFFAFNDFVHPTGAGHAIFGVGLESIFTAPDIYSSMPALALASSGDQMASFRTQMSRFRFSDEGASVLLNVSNNTTDWNADFMTNGERSTEQLQVGYQAPMGELMRIGIAFTGSSSELTFGQSVGTTMRGGIESGSVDADSFGLALSLNFMAGGLYGEVAPEFSYGSMDTSRHIRILSLDRIQTASADYTTAGVTLESGYNFFADSGFELGPFVVASFKKASVDNLEEKQMNANAMFVDRQSWSETTAGYGLFAGYNGQNWFVDVRASQLESDNEGREETRMGISTIKENSFWLPSIERAGSATEIDATVGFEIDGFTVSGQYRYQDVDNLGKGDMYTLGLSFAL
ncbi:MAG: autotransporter domain-containing protein [Pseudomonadales bacterium]